MKKFLALLMILLIVGVGFVGCKTTSIDAEITTAMTIAADVTTVADKIITAAEITAVKKTATVTGNAGETTSDETMAAENLAAATPTETTTAETKAPENPALILASTTSTQDSGLFDVLIPAFENAAGYKVKVIAVGSGEAIKLGERGEADVLLVHSRKAEDKFVAGSFGIDRKDVMHNDFIIVGPASDPAIIKGTAMAADAFKAIAASESIFVSRADGSGTYTKELNIWQRALLEPGGDWYIQTGQGMGETLRITQEKQGYTLTDNATWYAIKSGPGFDLVELVKGDVLLFNPYGVIAVNPAKHPELKINYKGATAFIKFVTGAQGQKIIKEFGIDKYGIPLFYPDVIK